MKNNEEKNLKRNLDQESQISISELEAIEGINMLKKDNKKIKASISDDFDDLISKTVTNDDEVMKFYHKRENRNNMVESLIDEVLKNDSISVKPYCKCGNTKNIFSFFCKSCSKAMKKVLMCFCICRNKDTPILRYCTSCGSNYDIQKRYKQNYNINSKQENEKSLSQKQSEKKKSEKAFRDERETVKDQVQIKTELREEILEIKPAKKEKKKRGPRIKPSTNLSEFHSADSLKLFNDEFLLLISKIQCEEPNLIQDSEMSELMRMMDKITLSLEKRQGLENAIESGLIEKKKFLFTLNEQREAFNLGVDVLEKIVPNSTKKSKKLVIYNAIKHILELRCDLQELKDKKHSKEVEEDEKV